MVFRRKLKRTVCLYLCFYALTSLLLLWPFSLYAWDRAIASEEKQAWILRDEEYYQKLLDLLSSAQEEILVSIFLFKTHGYPNSYPDTILRELIAAVNRGVSVAVVMETDMETQSLTSDSNKDTAIRLRKGGVRVFFDSPQTKTHTKLIVVDRRYILTGSHNLTSSALKYNREMSILIESPILANKAREYIMSLYHKEFTQ